MTRRPRIPVPYPVDKRGFALPTYEVNDMFIAREGDEEERWNNHHHNFYASTFGRLAVSKTFRDLDVQQTPMVEWRHNLLHRLHTGIAIPPIENMIEEIEMQQAIGGRLKVFDMAKKCYQLLEITDEKMAEVKADYQTIRRAA